MSRLTHIDKNGQAQTIDAPFQQQSEHVSGHQIDPSNKRPQVSQRKGETSHNGDV